MIRASGHIPQVSVVVGFAAGGAAYGPALTDVVIMAPEGQIFVPPDRHRPQRDRRDVDMGPSAVPGPTTRSPVCAISSPTTNSTPTPAAAVSSVLLPAGHFDRTKAGSGDVDLHALLPESPRRAYDVHPSSGPARLRRPFEVPVQSGPLDGGRPRPALRTDGRRPGQQPAATRRLPELRSAEEGSAFRPAVQRLRHPLVVIVGVLATCRRGSGMGRCGAPWQNCCTPSAGHRSPGDPGHPHQDLRRRLYRDELAVAGRHQRCSPGRTPRSQ